MMRIGSGFDAHAFEAGDHVMLGGVRIAHDQAIAAHSDGDVLLHALADALLGASALGDIGEFYPPDDSRWQDADSRELLRDVVARLAVAGWRPGNIDCTIICQKPRVGPHRQAMRENIASDLDLNINAVSVKATTTDKLGFTGRGEGIACQAVVLIERL